MQLFPSELARGAESVLKRTPAEAVVELEMTVLLMKSRFNASSRETPPPSHPATLLAMILLVTVAWYHCLGFVGKATTSVPLTFWNRRPPPLPDSAALPMIRLALMTSSGPMPSLGATEPSGGRQSASVVKPHGGSTSGVPMTRIPPPLAVIVGLRLWLNTTVLCSMRPPEMNPRCPTPPPSPVLRLPDTHL